MARSEGRLLEDECSLLRPCKQWEMIVKTELAYIANVEKY